MKTLKTVVDPPVCSSSIKKWSTSGLLKVYGTNAASNLKNASVGISVTIPSELCCSHHFGTLSTASLFMMLSIISIR